VRSDVETRSLVISSAICFGVAPPIGHARNSADPLVTNPSVIASRAPTGVPNFCANSALSAAASDLANIFLVRSGERRNISWIAVTTTVGARIFSMSMLRPRYLADSRTFVTH
jgi:hypothetical protein